MSRLARPASVGEIHGFKRVTVTETSFKACRAHAARSDTMRLGPDAAKGERAARGKRRKRAIFERGAVVGISPRGHRPGREAKVADPQ